MCANNIHVHACCMHMFGVFEHCAIVCMCAFHMLIYTAKQPLKEQVQVRELRWQLQ